MIKMGYYCNICKKTITQGEYQYSMDKFDRALCREHQEIERKHNDLTHDFPIKQEEKILIKETQEIPNEEHPKGWKSIVKNVAVATGKGIIKGTKAIADTTQRSMQRRAWRDKILRRMSSRKIKQLAREKRIKPAFVEKPSTNDYIGAIKNRVSLEEIIAYAKRNRVNIRDILEDIDKAKADEELKKMRAHGENIDDYFMQVVEAINSFKPLREHKEEIQYQIDLARWLENKFPTTVIEQQRGSSRPDIIIGSIAIEIKGPTGQLELNTIASKCMRYSQHYSQGMIVVLFDVWVGQRYYDEWRKGLSKSFPDVVVIKKN